MADHQSVRGEDLGEVAEIGALAAARRSPEHRDGHEMLDDSAEEVAVERGAGRRIVFGNVEILSDRLGALAREKLDKVLVPDATVRSRFTGKRRRSEEHTSELQS